MGQALLTFLPIYLVVGVYRLVTDRELYRPIWNQSKSTLKSSLLYSSIYAMISYPVTKIWVRFFMRQTSISAYASPAVRGNGTWLSFVLKLSTVNVVTMSLVLSQIGWLVEFSLKRRLRKIRSEAYHMTVESRAKELKFWIPYVEEWDHPPITKAHRRLAKNKWHRTVSGPLFRWIILKVLLLPLHFVPFLNIIVSSFLSSLTLSEALLEPYFKTKEMDALQRATFVVEREDQLRWLGFFGSMFEKAPLVGIMFSITNRIGFAMLAHDFEKRQHLISEGVIGKRSQAYISKTQQVELDLPPSAVGNFPKKEN